MRDFIQSLTARLGINGLGRALGLNGSSVLAWVRGESLPSADLIGPLAALAQVNVEELRGLLMREQEARAARRRTRPSQGPTVSPVVPVPQRRRARGRRRKLAAWAFAVASASAWGQPLGGGSPRLITDVLTTAPTRGILSRWGRLRAV
jgi:hypothetical protein